MSIMVVSFYSVTIQCACLKYRHKINPSSLISSNCNSNSRNNYNLDTNARAGTLPYSYCLVYARASFLGQLDF